MARWASYVIFKDIIPEKAKFRNRFLIRIVNVRYEFAILSVRSKRFQAHRDSPPYVYRVLFHFFIIAFASFMFAHLGIYLPCHKSVRPLLPSFHQPTLFQNLYHVLHLGYPSQNLAYNLVSWANWELQIGLSHSWSRWDGLIYASDFRNHACKCSILSCLSCTFNSCRRRYTARQNTLKALGAFR